ncbi:MAG: benzoyl-CoA reductase, bzd-type, subunit O [Chloroflexi bacterium]|nr:benzoyl-CoA reductase, bzd-type, subunit O [Chloroflexota bacterium]
MAVTKYKTKKLECWGKAKELRDRYYKDFAEAKAKGGIRWAGGAWQIDAIPMGLGDDVYNLTSEPYGASVGHDPAFAVKCQEATEAKGFARDLCSYMRNEWGSVLLNKYYFGGEWPKPDFYFQNHICCTHAKWYQVMRDLEGGETPYFCVDVSAGPDGIIDEDKVDYVAGQYLDSIDWMQKVTGRKYDDEKLIKAVHNECRSTALWAETCALNEAIPAPLDEKTMYSLYVLGTLHKAGKEIADFYQELRDEVKDRVANQIAAVPNERLRIMTDSQPPWSALKLFRYLEQFGVVTIGSLYTFSLVGIWDVEPDGRLVPAKTPEQQGIILKNREDAVRFIVRWNLKKLMWEPFFDARLRAKRVIQIAKQWKVNGMMMHLNLGCEGTTIGNLESRLALLKEGIPVLTYEGNMGDDRQYDEVGTMKRVDIWMKSFGLEKIED